MSCLISGIRWRHRTWIQVETGERYTDDILLRIHNVLMEAQRPLREERQKTTWSFLSLVAAVSGRNWTQNPIVKGKNFLFFTLIIGWVFFDCSWANEFAGTFYQQTTKMKSAYLRHISVEMKINMIDIAQCEWVHRLQEFNLLVIQTPKIKLV